MNADERRLKPKQLSACICADRRLHLIFPPLHYCRGSESALRSRASCRGSGLDFNQEFGVGQARHAEQSASWAAAGFREAAGANFGGAAKKVYVGGVPVEAHYVGELEAGFPQHSLQVIQCSLNLSTHIAGMRNVAFGIDRRLPGTNQDALRAGNLIGLHESKTILPFPRVDDSALHKIGCQHGVTKSWASAPLEAAKKSKPQINTDERGLKPTQLSACICFSATTQEKQILRFAQDDTR